MRKLHRRAPVQTGPCEIRVPCREPGRWLETGLDCSGREAAAKGDTPESSFVFGPTNGTEFDEALTRWIEWNFRSDANREG